MRLLFLGHCSYYTIANFTIALKENYKGINITVADPIKPGGRKISEEEGKVFDEVIYLPHRKETKLKSDDKFKSFSKILKKKYSRNKFIKNIAGLRIKSLSNQINETAAEEKYSGQLKKIFENYDIFHFHYLSPEYLFAMKYIPENKKILLTFWGSDLFQISGVNNYKRQLEGLNRADLITVNSLEIKEAVLTKFGRNLYSKLRYADFSLSKSKLDRIEKRNNAVTIREFKIRNGIPEEKILLTLGYSASSKQRHIEILKILDELDVKIKSRIFVIIPMTYGLEHESGNYLDKVKDACKSVSFESKIFTDYMEEEEMIDFIISGGIKLNLRDTDALNAAMIESLFAGNILVNGAWLPYGKLRRLGIYYKEIEVKSELKNLIPYLIENYDIEKKLTFNNADLVRKIFLYENTISDWIKIFDELNAN